MTFTECQKGGKYYEKINFVIANCRGKLLFGNFYPSIFCMIFINHGLTGIFQESILSEKTIL